MTNLESWKVAPANDDHGRMVHMMPVPGIFLFWCPTCGRLLLMDLEATDAEKSTLFVRKGDLMAKHWGATFDGLRIGTVEVKQNPK